MVSKIANSDYTNINKSFPSAMALSCSLAKMWVKSHYERNEDGVVAKSVMYKHYEDVCRSEERNIMETSIFGRVVKSVFPDVTIRRLGGRDNLKYYYCGIQAKESSPYAIDNTTTTRPKRRLRKRELVTDKAEVHSCLKWLHANYVASHDSSVVKTDVYHRYINFCKARGGEPLSIQYFGMVITHAFPSVTKRKLGPRSNQQKFYFGIVERNGPMPLDVIPEIGSGLRTFVEVIPPKSTYRDTVDDFEDDDDEFSCRSPGSDMSDIGYINNHSYHNVAQFLKEESNEPVDYSLSSLRLKDEPVTGDIELKQEPIGNDDVAVFNHTPNHPHSNAGFSLSTSGSPSPPRNSMYPRKIYKPRFHYYEESDWNSDVSEDKRDGTTPYSEKSDSEEILKNWILHTFEISKGSHVDRAQVYEVYESYCRMVKFPVLPMVSFDETMLKCLPGVVTMIHPSGRTFYEGVKVRETSPFLGRVAELAQNDLKREEDDVMPNPMELSPSTEDLETAQSSPLSQDDDDIPELLDIRFSSFEEDAIVNSPSPGVIYDGKYYLRKWLTDNFYNLPESCVLKADAYRHYEIFIRSLNQTPFEMNVFGKIVRQVFPNVSIRRLGGRAKPQYHYCGIAVKESSPLHPYMSGKDPAQRSRKKEIATDNKSAEIVIDFLRRNFELGKHKIIMKSEVFDNYCLLCESLNETPVTLNYFGKLVKHCFPSVEVRKFGGRNEPVWYYFGLAAKNVYSGLSKTPNTIKHGQSPFKDCIFPTDWDFQSGLPATNRGSPFYGMESNGNTIRHSTSPIPINLHRPHIPPMSYFSSTSPSSFQYSSLQALLKASSYEENSHVSPADRSVFFRESFTPNSPAELFYSRSPIDYPLKCQNITMNPLDLNREYIQNHYRGGAPQVTPGQVVPSQTPPSLLLNHSLEENVASVRRQPTTQPPKNPGKPLTIQDEFGAFNEMAME